MIKQIDHINIVVTDLEESKNFFINLLGFELINEDTLEGEWIDEVVGIPDVKAKFSKIGVPGTQTNIELIQYYSPVSNIDNDIGKANGIGFRHLAFEVSDIEKLYSKLQKAGVKFFSDIKVTPREKKICYFTGPDNIILELAEY